MIFNPIFKFFIIIIFLFQGTIDANVMGGISKYQQAFFTVEFVQSEPHLVPYVHQLNALILDQVMECRWIVLTSICFNNTNVPFM